MKTMRFKIEVHRKQRKSYRRFIFKSIMFCREIFDKLLTEQNRQTRRKRQKKNPDKLKTEGIEFGIVNRGIAFVNLNGMRRTSQTLSTCVFYFD